MFPAHPGSKLKWQHPLGEVSVAGRKKTRAVKQLSWTERCLASCTTQVEAQPSPHWRCPRALSASKKKKTEKTKDRMNGWFEFGLGSLEGVAGCLASGPGVSGGTGHVPPAANNW